MTTAADRPEPLVEGDRNRAPEGGQIFHVDGSHQSDADRTIEKLRRRSSDKHDGVGVVVIGRNEGERLVRCLSSVVGRVGRVVYVDSGSTDASVANARAVGVVVHQLDTSSPFTAARARNAGFLKLIALTPTPEFVHFTDGDCTTDSEWFDAAMNELRSNPAVAAVCGRLREMYPDRTVYNRLCDLEWDTPVGVTESTGGNVFMRVAALREVNGYDETLIAGEEPELCARLRHAGWAVHRIDAEMTLHDAAMTRFSQWWRRAVRAGHAYAEVGRRHGRTQLRSWRRRAWSNWFWALGVPAFAVALGLLAHPLAGLLTLLAYPVLTLRIVRSRRRRGDSLSVAWLYARYQVLAKFPMALGQAKFHWNRMLGRRQALIEYKSAEAPKALRVAYLVNQYPSVSHSFIRREIQGLEASGLEVLRFTVRRAAVALVDDSDADEARKTRVILDSGPLGLLAVMLFTLVSRPLASLRGLRRAGQLARRSGKPLRTLVYFAEACQLRRWLARESVGHLHAHFGTNSTDVALLCHALGGPGYSLTAHGPEEFDRPEAIALGLKLRHARFAVAVSSFGRSQLFRWSPPDNWDKVHVAHCGVDAGYLDAGPLPPAAAPRIVCVGRLAEQKGQLLLVRAARELAKSGVRFELVFAGDGPLRTTIEAAVAHAGLGDSVQITGWLSNDGVRRELTDARVMALASFAEGLPVVIMEALALGRPVVSTMIAGIPELVRHGQTGWLVPAGDVHALAEALSDALACDDETLAAMGRAGAEAVRERHNALTEAAKLARLFRDATSPPPPAGGTP